MNEYSASEIVLKQPPFVGLKQRNSPFLVVKAQRLQSLYTHSWPSATGLSLDFDVSMQSPRAAAMASRTTDKRDEYPEIDSRRAEEAKLAKLERAARAIRSLQGQPMSQALAEVLAKRLGVHWRTVYRYRDRLAQGGEVTALVGRPRGWKPTATRLTPAQEKAIEQVIAALRRSGRPMRMLDLVARVRARCDALMVPCPSRPAVDRRIRRAEGLRVQRQGRSLVVGIETAWRLPVAAAPAMAPVKPISGSRPGSPKLRMA